MPDKPVLEKKFNENIDIEKHLKGGAMLARFFIEVQSNDKDAAKKALERTIFDSLGSEKSVNLLDVKFYKLQEDNEQGHYSGVVEVKLIVKDFRWFVNIVMRYGPTAIEIIEPESVHLSLGDMQSILADASEVSQMFSSKILALLKDDERRAIYEKMMKGAEG